MSSARHKGNEDAVKVKSLVPIEKDCEKTMPTATVNDPGFVTLLGELLQAIEMSCMCRCQ